MKRTIIKFILSVITTTQFLSADIGHSSVVYEGKAGEIPLRVYVQLPGVVPGLADISVRVFADDGILYREEATNQFTFTFTNRNTIASTISTNIEVKLKEAYARHFYYLKYGTKDLS